MKSFREYLAEGMPSSKHAMSYYKQIDKNSKNHSALKKLNKKVLGDKKLSSQERDELDASINRHLREANPNLPMTESFNISKGAKVAYKYKDGKMKYGKVTDTKKVMGKPGVVIKYSDGSTGRFEMSDFKALSMDRKADYVIDENTIISEAKKLKVGQKIKANVPNNKLIHKKTGTIKKVGKNQVDVDFGNGDVFGISHNRIKNGMIVEDHWVIIDKKKNKITKRFKSRNGAVRAMKKLNQKDFEMTPSYNAHDRGITEAKKPKVAYDISDFPEDGLDDLMWALAGMGKAKQSKDWDLIDTKKGLQLHTYSPKGSKAAEKFFGKKAPELIK